ncbi:hypothetical protein [Streptomyces sp. NPDC048521]|uniref:hypothetical protein n=1 Tax=Streptomyces sp. NPDC048521 TaxID=3365566 RepID=UPI0037115740
MDHDLGRPAGAQQYAEDHRGARMPVDATHGTAAGVTSVGPGVGELLHPATIAVMREDLTERLRHAVPAFLTISGVWLRVLETYRDAGGR